MLNGREEINMKIYLRGHCETSKHTDISAISLFRGSRYSTGNKQLAFL
jgi:hypothetical protein